MKTFVSLIIILLTFISCVGQKVYQKIPKENYQLLTTFSAQYELSGTHFFKNETELNNMYATLPKDYKKSLPRFVIDYEQNQIILIPHKHINSYNIESITGNEKIYNLHLTPIKGINQIQDSSNLLMMIVPKSVKKILVKTK